jgi:UDP-GlcNAc:undecaprenyl-phosphate GlcNAc-1-phosphate transferase
LIIAAGVSLAWCLVAIWLGPRIGYLDRPDDPTLKAHERAAVPLGGVGIFLAVHLAAITRGELDPVLLLASGVVLVLGLVDDRRGLSPSVRLGVELMAALALVLGSRVESDDPVAIVLGIALVVLAINAVNLFDGLDGLAGSVTLVTALGLTWLATGRDLTAIAPLELAAAVAGFLVLNWHPARVFLGDSGAYVVGLVLAHLIIDASPSGALQMVVTTGTLGVLAIDLVVTLLRRRVSGHPMFTGDRSHIYDQLRDRGWSVPKVAIGMATAQAAIVVIVYGVDRVFGAAWPSLLALTTILAGSVALLSRLGFLRAGQR